MGLETSHPAWSCQSKFLVGEHGPTVWAPSQASHGSHQEGPVGLLVLTWPGLAWPSQEAHSLQPTTDRWMVGWMDG